MEKVYQLVEALQLLLTSSIEMEISRITKMVYVKTKSRSTFVLKMQVVGSKTFNSFTRRIDEIQLIDTNNFIHIDTTANM